MVYALGTLVQAALAGPSMLGAFLAVPGEALSADEILEAEPVFHAMDRQLGFDFSPDTPKALAKVAERFRSVHPKKFEEASAKVANLLVEGGIEVPSPVNMRRNIRNLCLVQKIKQILVQCPPEVEELVKNLSNFVKDFEEGRGSIDVVVEEWFNLNTSTMREAKKIEVEELAQPWNEFSANDKLDSAFLKRITERLIRHELAPEAYLVPIPAVNLTIDLLAVLKDALSKKLEISVFTGRTCMVRFVAPTFWEQALSEYFGVELRFQYVAGLIPEEEYLDIISDGYIPIDILGWARPKYVDYAYFHDIFHLCCRLTAKKGSDLIPKTREEIDRLFEFMKTLHQALQYLPDTFKQLFAGRIQRIRTALIEYLGQDAYFDFAQELKDYKGFCKFMVRPPSDPNEIQFFQDYLASLLRSLEKHPSSSPYLEELRQELGRALNKPSQTTEMIATAG